METTNLKDRVYGHIRQKLGVGELRAGHRISETKMAKELGVSRTPVREAIRRLESEGVVLQIPRFGTFIRKLTLTELKDVWDLRQLLEDYAVSRAAVRRSDEDIRKLKSIIENMREIAHKAEKNITIQEYADFNKMAPLDLEFHQLIAVAAGNALVADMKAKNDLLANLVTTVLPSPKESMNPFLGQNDELARGLLTRTLHIHWQIFRGIRDRNVESARYWMEKHMTTTIENIMRLVGPDLPSDERLFNYGGYSVGSIEGYTRNY